MKELKNKIEPYVRLDADKSEKIYLVKCVLGVILCYSLYYVLPTYPIYWAVVSTVLVFSPENNNKLAYDRIKCNLLGSAIGLALYFLPLPNIILLGIGVGLTILIGLALHFDKTIRTALASVVIVLVEESATKDWLVAIERVICVVIGCAVALLITKLFTRAKELKNNYK